MPDCPHNRIIGDDSGETCMDCGAQIAGYGYWGRGDGKCRHHFMPVGDFPPEDPPKKDLLYVCIYCEEQIIRSADWPQKATK